MMGMMMRRMRKTTKWTGTCSIAQNPSHENQPAMKFVSLSHGLARLARQGRVMFDVSLTQSYNESQQTEQVEDFPDTDPDLLVEKVTVRFALVGLLK